MSLKPGQTLGQYQIVEQIGKGGMATVYRSWQPSLARHVAIKVLPEYFTHDPSFQHRFRQEAMAIAQLRHPNVLTVFDSGEADGVAYIVTELVEGGTLAGRLGKAMPVDECLRLIAPVAEALDYAHARGMIHRDVKPANILLGADGVPILSDFGLVRMQGAAVAAAAEARTRLTMAGGMLGTPEYMAPEQIESSDVGPAADIYALAVILYEMLTGTIPYAADTPVSVLVARLKDPLPRPRDRNPNLSHAVQNVLLKGLARDPKERYGSAGGMVRALAAADAPVAASTSASSTTRTVAVAAAVVVLVGGVAVFVTRPRPGPPPAVAPATSTTAPIAAPVAAATSAPVPVTTPAEPAAPAPKPVSTQTPQAVASAKASDGLPPHGKLLYSMTAPSADTVPPATGEADAIVRNGGAFDITVRTESGVQSRLPVEGVGDFVAVLKYAVTARRPVLTFRFRQGRDGRGYAARWPAFLSFSPPPADTPAAGSHTCCLTLDVFRAPQRPDTPALLEGPQPVTLPSRDGEEQVIAVSVSGPDIAVFAGDREIARARDATFGQGGMSFGINAGRDELPASVHLTALDIYEPASSGKVPVARPPAHGKLLFAVADHLPAMTQLPQRSADNTITADGTSLVLKAGSEEMLTAPLDVNGIGSFVAVMKYAVLGFRPALRLRFGDHLVQIPTYLRLGPAVDGTPASGPHTCCWEFDIMRVPQAPGLPTLFTAPPPRAVGAALNQEQTVTVSVKGQQIVVYADDQEIARATDDMIRPGAMALQVQAFRRQVPAVVRLNALEIYEP